ncbi:hypothetical protein Bpfe_014266 [Biomphalaria pfeifferi]|uniref:G-protein coupled receptors family 1 profile domain-containing protein n=1 Tax=Biomphalaria pfeifferi TaxID=112525 RepID=A0AAD8FAM6_BIOPF|nr:hypothetical protein Bpfe_014266 [Biomphalaria pfeifferi]
MSSFKFDEHLDNHEYLTLENTTAFNWTFVYNNWTARFSQSQEYSRAIKIRNFWIGAVGIVLNLVGLFLLVSTKNIKWSLKISLMSLTFNDLMFLSGLVANSQLKSLSITTDHPSCWPLLMVCYTSILISYISTSQLAFQNVIAVYYPLRCHQIATPAKIASSCVAIWIAGFILGVVCVGVKFDGNLPCIAFIPISTWGIGLYAILCILCAAVVSAINIKIFHKIWSVNRIVHVAPGRGDFVCSDISRDLKAREYAQNSMGSKVSDSKTKILHEEKSDSVNIKSGVSYLSRYSQGNVAKKKCDMWTTHSVTEGEIFPKRESILDQHSECSSLEASRSIDCNKHVGILFAKHPQTYDISLQHSNNRNKLNHIKDNVDLPNNKSRMIKTSHLSYVPKNDTKCNSNKSRTSNSTKNDSQNVACTQSQKTAKNIFNLDAVTSSSSQSSRILSVAGPSHATALHERAMRRHGQVKVRNTLLLLTFWCCFVTLPFLVSIIILISSKSFEKVEFAQSHLGIALSSLVTLNASTNPILYAWRFVQWKRLYTNTRSFIRNRWTFR